MGKVFDDILKFIEALNVIDTHEHLPSREDERYSLSYQPL